MEEFKEYLRPNYSPSDFEDPPFDEDDDDDDYSDTDEGEEDEKMNNYIKEQEKLNERIMTQSPFQSTQQQNTTPSWNTVGNTWGGQQSTPWGQNNQPSWGSGNNTWQRPSWGQQSNQPSWGSGNNTWGGQQNNQKLEINRQKKYIFCDVLDCLIETWQSNGRPGLLPRGIYDVRLRFEVWDKIACFNPEKIYALVSRNLILSSNGSDSWRILLDYVVCSLSEYLRVPYNCCQILAQKEVGISKDIVFKTVIEQRLKKEDVIQIGIDSGLVGQSNRDILSSKNADIDYIDLGQLMTIYY